MAKVHSFNSSDEDTIKIQNQDISRRMQLEQMNLKKEQKKMEQSKWSNRKIIAVRIFANLIIFGSIAGVLYLIAEEVINYTPKLLRNENQKYGDYVCKNTEFGDIENLDDFVSNWQCLLISYLSSLTITAANIILPFMFSYIIRFEKYNPNMELILNIGETPRCGN